MIVMSMSTAFVPEKHLLDLCFDGNLDLTVTDAVFAVVSQVRVGVQTCIMDLTRVERVFDSGIALLRMLSADLRRIGVAVVILADQPDAVRWGSLIRADVVYPSRRHFRPTLATGSGPFARTRSFIRETPACTARRAVGASVREEDAYSGA
jgi:hypothetical protein